VTIERDRFGVPFVTGVTAEDVAFGAGWAGTHDRMFLTDLLRHVGAARTAEFLGGTPGNIAMDVGQLRSAAYTREEVEAQLDKTLARYPQEGQALLARLDAFVDGINDAQRALCPLAFGVPVGTVTGGEAQVGVGFGPQCPVEYAALRNPPTDFTRGDIVYIASLVGGIFGKGGGGEAANARWLQQLEAKYGRAQAIRIFEDLRERNDPKRRPPPPPASRTRGGRRPVAPGPRCPTSRRRPRPDGRRRRWAPAAGPAAGAAGQPDLRDRRRALRQARPRLRPKGMSNALLVDAKHSATGHPTVVFGPQTGYFTPAAAHRDLAARAGHRRARRLLRRHAAHRRARPRRRLRLVGDLASGDLVDTVADGCATPTGRPRR
jgi:acyl-homoserine lactone acylase PvdQ